MLKIIKWFRSPARSNTRLLLVVLLSLFLLAQAGDPSKCAAQGSCPEPVAYGRQPYPNELVDAFERAGTNRLGANGPDLPQIWNISPVSCLRPLATLKVQAGSSSMQIMANMATL